MSQSGKILCYFWLSKLPRNRNYPNPEAGARFPALSARLWPDLYVSLRSVRIFFLQELMWFLKLRIPVFMLRAAAPNYPVARACAALIRWEMGANQPPSWLCNQPPSGLWNGTADTRQTQNWNTKLWHISSSIPYFMIYDVNEKDFTKSVQILVYKENNFIFSV